MRKFFVVIFSWLLVYQSCFAAAVPVSRMQGSTSGLIQQKVASRGFAANDPRFGATLSAVSTTVATIAGTAAVVAVGTITAPAWVTFVLAAGVGTIVTYGVSVGLDGLFTWLFKPNAIDVSTSSSSSGIPGIGTGIPFWVGTGSGGITVYGGDGLALARQLFYDTVSTVDIPSCSVGAQSVQCYKGGAVVTVAKNSNSAPPATCPGGNYYSGSVCKPYAYPVPTIPPALNQTPQQAIDALTDTEKARPLNPQLLAAAANLAWQKASAAPGYDGIPYSPADPITSADALNWKNANPNTYPTVSDFVAPQPAANLPWSMPVSPTATTQDPAVKPGTATNPAAANPLQNLGSDPNIGAPAMEETPTAENILKPVMDLMPGFKNFVVPSHSGVCPKPEFTVFSQHIIMDSQCNLAEQNRSALFAVMAAVWALCAAFIVLKA
ncbi:hypothetical protein [Massilia sp. CCM 8734]|uniref:hypothetical protein n=1 Tax=Massilia sp. CCM 8734 TaxID=2609283 RepID=UPI00142342C4|nr:hypothetical protein [Massilia sp. CCM 8734]NHZ96532.1 hypothetical protein [Massilia sp. CCM 8734]